MKLPIKIFIFTIEIFSVLALIVFNIKMSAPTPQEVHANDIVSAQNTPQATLSPTAGPEVVEASGEATPSAQPSKKSYIIAFMGDSLIDTMGGGLPYVYKALKNKYPSTDFVLYNYGIGSENVISGLSRFILPYSYKDRQFPAIPELGADIIVLGSYAYNPITPFDKDQEWLLESELIGKAKETGAEVYILAEQAPIKDGFGEGPGGVNWPPEISGPHVDKIVAGLKNAVGLADATKIGLIDVYDKTKVGSTDYGDPKYVSTHDGIHYSEEGQILTAKIVADSIKLK